MAMATHPELPAETAGQFNDLTFVHGKIPKKMHVKPTIPFKHFA